MNDIYTQNNMLTKNKKFLVFVINKMKYCVPLSEVKEIVSPLEVTPVPSAPNYFRGLINLRGQIISIVDLGKKLNHPETKICPKKTCIIIFKLFDVIIGTLVDEIMSVEGFSQVVIEEATVIKTGKQSEFVTGVIKTNNDLILALDLKNALNIEELKAIQEKLVA